MVKLSTNKIKLHYIAVNFDLDTDKMAVVLGSKTAGYDKLKRSFKKVGFIHRQGSGYVSKKPLSDPQTAKSIRIIARQNPWLLTCLNKMDVTEIGDFYDVVPLVKAEAKKQVAQEKRRQKAELKDAISQGSGKSTPQQTSTSNKTASKAQNSSITQSKQKTTTKSVGKGLGL